MDARGRPLHVRDLTLPELQAWVHDQGLPGFRARQIFSWVHGRGARSTAVMTDLAKELRVRLARQLDLTPLAVDAVQRAGDGTRKARLRCRDGALVETVLIPDGQKVTQCLSSQVGCGLGCTFCATATMGMRRNLTTGEILDQVYRAHSLLTPGERVSNLVFMGMGEPMNNLTAVLHAVEILCTDIGQNFSPRRITISTAGVVPGIDALGRQNPAVGLAVSLNATNDTVRSRLMPVNRRWSLARLMEALRRYPLPRRRRITMEYVLIHGVNDSPADARALPGLLDRLKVKVNLISYNPGPAGDPLLRRPPPEAVERFADILRQKQLGTYLRRSRGQDIAAACGQLATAGGARQTT